MNARQSGARDCTGIRMKRALIHGALSSLLIAFGSVNAASQVLRVDALHVTARVSPLHAGLMTEEINHSYDGGLYAELISNRVFKDEPAAADSSVPHWAPVREGSASVAMRVDAKQPLDAELNVSLRLDAIAASAGNRAGAANDGFWGIPIKPATSYRASFYGKADKNFTGPIRISIEDAASGTAVVSTEIVLTADSAWHRYEAMLTTANDIKPSKHNRFVISTETAGTVWLTLISLFPPTYHGIPNGNRIDLMQKLADMKPAFLRFPGGNYLEGDTTDTRFKWKETIGDLATRPTHNGPWGYRSSDGLGLLEFLEWCEALGVEPVLGLYAGISFNESGVHSGPALKPFVQDAIDEIEYITGGLETRWGAVRAKNGHPAPFKLAYAEIGNEDWAFPMSDYEGRFAQFHDALKARYPDLQLIATTPVKSRTPDLIDEHYYCSAAHFFQDVHHFDRYDRRGPKIFVGEWATIEGEQTPDRKGTESEPTPNLHAALGDAAWMIGMEANSDLVVMQAYAPLLANVNQGAYQWRTNLIGYDALTSYGSPSYYAQVMFNGHRGDEVLSSSPEAAPGLFFSTTRSSRTGTIYLKVVNAVSAPRAVRIEIAGVTAVEPTGTAIVLTGDPGDANSLRQPERIVPVESQLSGLGPSFEHTFPAFSISVLQLQAR